MCLCFVGRGESVGRVSAVEIAPIRCILPSELLTCNEGDGGRARQEEVEAAAVRISTDIELLKRPVVVKFSPADQ